MIFPAKSQRARYSQASLSVSNRFTRPFSYATAPCQNALNAPFAVRSTLLLWILTSAIMTRLPSYNYGRNHQPRWAYPMGIATSTRVGPRAEVCKRGHRSEEHTSEL